jgi:hypothetical protein
MSWSKQSKPKGYLQLGAAILFYSCSMVPLISDLLLDGHSISPRDSPPVEGTAWYVRHQFPGRVRLWVPALETHSRYATWLQSALVALPGVTHVRINRMACSVVIQYQPAAVEQLQAHLTQVLTGLGRSLMPAAQPRMVQTSMAEPELACLPQTPDQGTAATPDPTSRPAAHWHRLQLPILASVLASSGRCRIDTSDLAPCWARL